jgi:CRISPR-associated RAMP protein (TIGR02581 family)
MTVSPFAATWKAEKKLYVSATLVFDTGWRVGSGRSGQTSDLGVLQDTAGRPLLPGSSLKGKLRNTCESLAETLGLKACMLNVQATGVACASDVSWFSKHRKEHRDAVRKGTEYQLKWIREHTCDVCCLFGSPVHAARLRCADGRLKALPLGSIRVRDGVVLDRDSHTAVDGLKYDYECVSPDVQYYLSIEVDNPRPQDEALLGAALFEWSAGSSLGSFTSRGLGRFHLDEVQVHTVDFTDAQQRQQYLLGRNVQDRMRRIDDWGKYFQDRIDQHLASLKG